MTLFHIRYECKHKRILCGRLSIPHNIVMDLNNVMNKLVKVVVLTTPNPIEVTS